MKKEIISRSEVEDFYTEDKSNINFWLARAEKYTPNKVINTCLKAGASLDVAKAVANELDNYADSRIKMSEVRPLIYKFLLRRDRNAALRFKAGEIYVDTSLETVERFNRKKIAESLIREANVEPSKADQISFEAERFIKAQNLDHLSSPLIREIVSVKMLEHGLRKERNFYTRIGMPVYDLTKLINRGTKENANLQYNPETIHKIMADAVSKEYTMLKILPHDVTDAHLKGQIHIHDMDYFFSRPFCFSHDIRYFLREGFKPDGTGKHTSVAGPAKKAEVAFLHAAKVLAAAQTNCAGGQGFSFFNTFMAPVVQGLSEKKLKQMAQMFIYEMSQMYVARGGQTVFSSVDLDMHVPEMLKDIPAIQLGGKIGTNTYGDYEDETKGLFNAFLDVYMEGDYNGKPFNFPKFEVQLMPEDLKKDKYHDEVHRLSQLAGKFGTPYYIIKQPYMPEFSCYQCCAYLMPLEESSDKDDMLNGTVRGGSLQVITINLPQIAYDASNEETRIYEIIDERLLMIKRIMMLRRDLIERNLQNHMLPFMSQVVNEKGDRYYEPMKQSYTVGVLGFNEMVKSFMGKELHESKDAWLLALKIMKYLKTRVAEMRTETGMNFALAETPAESTAYRFAMIDKKRYPKKAVFQGDVKNNSIYYTNSFHVRPDANIPLFQRMQIEGAFHPLTDGGAMSHVWLNEAQPSAEGITELTKQIATKTAIQYMSFTKDLSICDDCGTVTGAD